MMKAVASCSSTPKLESQRSRALIDRLREHGLDKYIELPQVAIMGDTSSGKSSVLSALSGIIFPSSEKLTTRCPTQLILTFAKEFSGTVTLKRYTPRPNDQMMSTTILSKEDITKQIELLTQQLVAEKQHISDDSIVIKVSGPDLPNLTLIDLPGIVRTTKDGEDKAIIDRIRGLVNRYLKQTRTVILAVVPANVDIHNTEILHAAEEADPDGSRTQAIITKLDLIDEGAEESVVELLLNKTKVLKLGYHAVKCRGQKELNDGVSIQQGIEKEALYFENSPIWGESCVPTHLVGIDKLRSKLVDLLEDIIFRELPNVIRDIDFKIKECNDDLAKLGPPMDSSVSRRSHFSKALDSYYDLLLAAIKGTYTNPNVSAFFETTSDEKLDNRFRAIVGKKEEVFQKKIAAQTHTIQYIETKEISVGNTVEIKSKASNTIWYGTVQKMEIKSRDLTNCYTISVLTEGGKTMSFHSEEYVFGVKSLDKIRQTIKDNKGDELPIFPSYNAFCTMVRTYIISWELPMMELFSNYENTLSKVSHCAIEHIKYRSTLKSHLEFKISDFLVQQKKIVSEQLKEKLCSELRPYTQNHYLHDVLTKLRNKPLLEEMEALNPTGSNTNVPWTAVMAILKNHGVGQTSNEDHVAIQTEYGVIAYLKVASKRFIDEIPYLLNDHLLEPFLRKIKEGMDISDDLLAKLLAENPKTVQERKELVEKLESLTVSKEEVCRMEYCV